MIADSAFMERLHNEIGNFYILPSSIHEIIAVPASGGFEIAMLYSMVKEVNSTAVSEEDFLSDIVYFYDGNKITVA